MYSRPRFVQLNHSAAATGFADGRSLPTSRAFSFLSCPIVKYLIRALPFIIFACLADERTDGLSSHSYSLHKHHCYVVSTLYGKFTL